MIYFKNELSRSSDKIGITIIDLDDSTNYLNLALYIVKKEKGIQVDYTIVHPKDFKYFL